MPRILFIIILFASKGASSPVPGPDSQGPVFIQEPKSNIEFLNDSGYVLTCLAKGSPDPIIVWFTADGNTATNIPNIRQVGENGSLIFPPFGAESYRQDVHNTDYRCQVSNDVGKIISRDISVQAIVKQHFIIEVSDVYVLKGNIACLRCDPPAFVKNLLTVTSWVQDTSYNIYPLPYSDGKLHMLPTGELVIYNVDMADSLSTFRCRTVHHVTGATAESTNGRAIVTEGRGSVPLKFQERIPLAPVRQGETAVVTCFFQGSPPPIYYWLRGETRNDLRMIASSERINIREGVLVIQNVQIEDAGLYLCYANNSLGYEELEQSLSVYATISIHLSPQQVTVDLGHDAELFCSVSGYPPPSIQWLKDTIPLRNTTLRIRIYGEGDSRILISRVTREDRGMYQCIAKNDYDMAQSSSELRLGDAAPQLIYKFIEQTMQPGPAVSLKCIATGNPTPKIIWAVDGFPLTHSDRLMIGQYVTIHGDVISHVNISSSRVEDGGEYRCVASNRVGQVRHVGRLNIYGLPLVRPMTSISAVAGKDLVLQCPVSGYPISSISWMKGDQILPTNRRQEVAENGTLVLQKVDNVSDQGTYSCTARNKQGHHDTQNVVIDVKVPPKLETFSFASDIQEGARVVVTCVVRSGDLPLRLEWLFNLHPTLPEGTTTYSYGEDVLSLSIPKANTHHTGNYTCVASNAADSVSHQAPLVVLVPPRIAPFNFNKDLSEGVRAQVSCVIEKGDPPFAIVWFKDRHPLPTEGLKVIGWDTHSSTVMVDELLSHHAGNYTCQVTNDVATDQHTAQLVVSVQPRWLEKPKDQQAPLGARNYRLSCHAEGNPPPVMTWRRHYGPQSQYQDMTHQLPNSGIHVDPNGTIVFDELKKEHQGYYLCEAGNGVGSLLSQRIYLTVNAPPHFATRFSNQTSRLGANAILRCDADGDSPLKIVWKKNGNALDPVDAGYRLSEKLINKTNGIISEMQIINTVRDDGGRYYCLASNSFGRDEMTIQLYLQEPPDFPRNIHVLEKNSRSVKLGWVLSQDGNSAVIQSIIEYKQDPALWNDKSNAINIPIPQMTATVGNLKPATLYHFRLFAENVLGQSQPSDVLEVTTDGEAPSGPPRNVQIMPITSTSLHIKWDAPDPELSNGDILGYHVGYKETSNEQFVYKAVESRIDGASQVLLTDLRKFTKYQVQVQAYNALGPGPTAQEVIGTTLEDTPSAPPQDVRCTSPNSQSLHITWNPVHETQLHGHLKGYKVGWENTYSSEYESTADTKIVTTLSAMIQNLDKFTNYSVQVLAFTNAGEGVACVPIYCVTQEDLPEAPSTVRAVAASSTSIVVSWQPPKKTNGILTGYFVTVKFAGGPVSAEIKPKRYTIKADRTYLQQEELHRRGQYEFTVSALTRVGEGPKSTPVILSPSAEVRATIYSFNSVISLPWKVDARLPCHAVGRPDLTFNWKLWNHPIKPTAKYKIHSDGTLLIRGIAREDSGNYSCHAENKHGSDTVTHRLVVQVPPAAPLLHVTSTTAQSIQLQWKKTDDGGARIRGFVLYYQKSEANRQQVQKVDIDWRQNTYHLKDLLCGTVYQLTLEAVNEIGHGAKSEVVTASTEGAKPTPVAQESFVQPNTTFAVLLLENWIDNGCAIGHFEVAYRQTIATEWTVVSNNVENQQQFIMRGLVPSTDYTLKIKAHNLAGATENLYQFSTLPKTGLVTYTLTPHGTPTEALFYHDPKLFIPIIMSGIVLLCGIITLYFCLVKPNTVAVDSEHSATMENQKNHRSRQEPCYSTLRKNRTTALPSSPDDRIPEFSEDIYPYATFQLNSAPLGGESRCASGVSPERVREPRGQVLPMQTFHYSDTLRSSEPHPMRQTKSPYREKFVKGEHEEFEYDSMASESDPEISAAMNNRQRSCTDGRSHMIRSGISRLSRQPRMHIDAYNGIDSCPSSDTSPVFKQQSFTHSGRCAMLQLEGSSLQKQWTQPIPTNDFGRHVSRGKTDRSAWGTISRITTMPFPQSTQPEKSRKPAPALSLGTWGAFKFETAPVLLPPTGFADGVDVGNNTPEEVDVPEPREKRNPRSKEYTITV